MVRAGLLCGLLLMACGDEERPRSTPRTETFEPVQLVAGIAWRAGEPFLGRRPASAMRTAEYAVAGHEDAELVVFHFRTEGPDGEPMAEGGSVDENVGRWLEQFEQPDGRPTREVAEIETTEVDGRSVTTVSVTGTFSGMRGSGALEDAEGYALRGAIVEAPEGLVFFKLLGPREAVTACDRGFDALVDSIRVVHE